MTGFPWPLNLVQDWFESLWTWIGDAAVNAVSVVYDWVWGAVNWLWDLIHRWFDMAVESIAATVNAVWTSISGALGGLWDQIVRWFDMAVANIAGEIGRLWTSIYDTLGTVWYSIWTTFTNLGASISDSFTWVWNNVSAGLNTLASTVASGITEVVDTVVTMYDGAVATVSGFLSDAMSGVAEALGSGLQTLWTWLTTAVPAFFTGTAGFINEHVITPIMAGLGWVFDRICDVIRGTVASIQNLFAGHSPITGEEALGIGVMAAVTAAIGGGALTALVDLASTKVVGSGLELRSLGHFVTQLINPGMFISAVLGVLVAQGVRLPVTHFYNKLFRPVIPAVREAQSMLWRGKLNVSQFRDILAMSGYRDIYEEGFVELTKRIPPTPDLVRMVVREAFLPEMVVAAPPIFADYLTKSGFSKEWADRYWTAHFVPISLAQAYANLWRGYWDKAKFMYALHIADIHPMWREDIYNVAFRPPGVREMGYGYDTGMYTVEDIVKYRRWGGLSPEDAEKAGRAMVAYRTEAEREALRREAIYDFTDGLDSEESLRAKLAAIGGRPEIIDLWVARAKYRTDRDIKRDLIKVVKDQFVKGYMDEAGLRSELAALGVVPERVEVHVAEGQTRRLSYIRAATIEKKRRLTEAKLAKAWELGLIGDTAYISGLVERDYTETDAKLMLEILRTPVPITPEEVERRKASITARINRVKRRYELMITRLDSQLSLISDQITTRELTQKEVLDVYDTELAYLGRELAVAPPEKVPSIEKRIALIRERRDVQVARHIETMTRLKDNLAAAATRKDELIKLRDEEITELAGELETIGAVAG